MTAAASSLCPLQTQAEPDCARRLVLRECREQWRRDATHGVVDTGRYRCRYVAWGQGPALVLIPGLAMDALAYVMLMARLKAHFCCISFDFPNGDGDGARLISYRYEDHVADLFALLDHLAIRQCVLFAPSFSSPIGLTALHREARRFSHAILQGAFAHRPLAWTEVLAASFGRFLPGRVGHLPFAERILAEGGHREPFLAREPDVWQLFAEHNLRVPLAMLAARALMIHRLDLRPILPEIHTPVLLVRGDRDPLVGEACKRELLTGLPNAAHAEIEQCGHFPQLTHPEVLAEVVQQYIGSPLFQLQRS